MDQLLVPTDFSENAEQAYPYALKIAAKTGSKVMFWLTIEEPYDFAIRVDEKMKEVLEYAKDYFEKLIGKYAKHPEYSDLEIDYQIVQGKIMTGILKGIKEIQADWVVMGTKGSTGLKKLLFGSNASHVVCESPVPVLVIPNQSRYDGFRKIVFTTEYQEKDIDLLRSLVAFASLWNSSIQIVHISKEKSLKSDSLHEVFKKKVEAEIHYERIEIIVEYASNFLDGIAGYQKYGECSLLVMGRYDLNILKEIFDYSETKAMSFYSQTPLLVLPVN